MMNSHLIDSDGSPGQRTLASVDLRNNFVHSHGFIHSYVHTCISMYEFKFVL